MTTTKEVSLYVLYDHYYPREDEGSVEYPVAAVIASEESDANVMFVEMGFTDMRRIDIRNVPTYNIEGTMFKFPDYMLPF